MTAKTQILRLVSTTAYGVGGPAAGIIDLIYSFLLQEFGQDVYNYITINQIDEDLNEIILKERNDIHINIRYPTYEDFELKNKKEQHLIRLEVVHTALLRIAERDKKLDIDKLELIKNKIVENDFSFDFIYRSHVNKKCPTLIAKIIVHPEVDRFNFYVVIEEDKKEKCRALIYMGICTNSYFADFFFFGKWKSTNELIITGKEKEVEIHVWINECKVEFINLTRYDKPPSFEMRRAGITDEDKEKAYQDWLHSLPPAMAAALREADN